MIELKILDIIGTPNAILHKFGIQVFEVVGNYLKENKEVVLSFSGLKNATTGFCNASIGNLYFHYHDSIGLLKIRDFEHNPILKDKIQQSIDLVTKPDRLKYQKQALNDLLNS